MKKKRRKIYLGNFVFIFFLLFLTLYSTLNICTNSSIALSTRQVTSTRDLPNFRFVTRSVMRGGQPTEEGLRRLAYDYNVNTILSFRRNQRHNDWERSIAESLGMTFINIPMYHKEMQSINKIDMCLDIIADKTNQPIFVHCYLGKDRTGLIFAAYRIKYDNWNFDYDKTTGLHEKQRSGF